MSVPAGALRDAGLSRRVAALVMDVALLAASVALLALVLWKAGVAAALRPEADTPLISLWQGAAAAGPLAAGLAAVVLACWRLLGGTPGALLLGVVLTSREGARPDASRCALRLAACVVLAGLGLLWSVGGRPALHDRLSGTRLVLEDEALARDDADAGAAT